MAVPSPRRAADAQAEARAAFALDVRRDLGSRPKRLQSKYLYDALGSSLFEAICELPWYRITRAERRLLAMHGEAILAGLGHCAALVDLGCGSGEKAVILAEAVSDQGRSMDVHLVDLSSAALAAAERRLSRLDHLSVVSHRATYEAGLHHAAAARSGPGAALVLFLGSNIGNFDTRDALALLRTIRAVLRPGDGLLLGADLVKPEAELRLAYDDPLGVTAAFNKNLLVRINAELGGDFDLDAFDHRAIWNAEQSGVEMHLVSRQAQRVAIEGAGCTVAFEPRETIWTESAYKYQPDGVAAMGGAVGLRPEAQWIEPDARFSLTLFRPA